MLRWAVFPLAGVLLGGGLLLLPSQIDAESVDLAYYSAVAALIPLLLLTLFTAFSRVTEVFVDIRQKVQRVQPEITEAKTQLAEQRAALDEIRHEAIARGSAAREQSDRVESLLGQVEEAIARVEELETTRAGAATDFRRIRLLQTFNVITAALLAAGGECAALVTLASAESSELGFVLTVFASVGLLLQIVGGQILDAVNPW